MYGKNLVPSVRGHVDNGLGKATPFGSFGIMSPTELVDRTGQEMTIDGIRFVFQYTPESEAPAELTFYLPDIKAFFGAELLSHNMHNLYTLRGAKVRDALKWSGYIDEAINLFGDATIYFGCTKKLSKKTWESDFDHKPSLPSIFFLYLKLIYRLLFR